MTRRKKKAIYRNFILILIIIAIAVLLVVARSLRREAAVSEEPDDPNYELLDLYVNEMLIPEDMPNRTGIRRGVESVVIHETGNDAEGANAKQHAYYLYDGGDGTIAWHYTVDDSTIYHHVPDEELAFHAGDRRTPHGGNMSGIGIEICVNADGDYEQALDRAERLSAVLLKRHGLKIKNLRQHADFADKNCPEHLRDSGRWAEFTEKVAAYYDQLERSADPG